MANSTTVQIFEDGPRNVICKFEGVLDTSDLSTTTVLDPATLDYIDASTNTLAGRLRIVKITYNIEDLLSVNLFWDATTPVRIESLEGRGKMDLRHIAGLQNNAAATGFTGKITATTQGWTLGGTLSFSIILECIKQL